MKKIETSNITGSQDAPFIKATFDHLNEANQNATSEIIKGMLGAYTTGDVIILYGCEVSGTIGPGTAAVTAGAIYYNGEIYQVDANASISTSGAQTLVWSVATTYRAGDPIQWSDGVNRNLHQIDKFVLAAGLSGSGIANYNATTVKRWAGVTQTATAGTTMSASGVTFGTETHYFTYKVINKMMHLSFNSSIVVTTGATVTKILFPLPTGITKDTTGASTGYIYNGFAYLKASDSASTAGLLVESYDDGTEGQRIKLIRVADASPNMALNNGVTLTIKGHITMPIQ
jgi:hypothetical protein